MVAEPSTTTQLINHIQKHLGVSPKGAQHYQGMFHHLGFDWCSAVTGESWQIKPELKSDVLLGITIDDREQFFVDMAVSITTGTTLELLEAAFG